MRRALPVLAVVLLAGCGGGGGGGSKQSSSPLLTPAALTAKAPATFRARFTTTKGSFTITVHRAWAPHGADRFYNLVANGFYDGNRLFRVVRGFVVQWGIPGDPAIAKAWEDATIPDDPVEHSNTPGTVAFAASSAPNSRTTQVFVNLGSNGRLDSYGFAPFGLVTSGGAAIDALYAGYDDRPTNDQQQMVEQGEAYFAKSWPKLDRIVKAQIVK